MTTTRKPGAMAKVISDTESSVQSDHLNFLNVVWFIFDQTIFLKIFFGPYLTAADLRHAFAVNSLRAGDDIKTVQENLGHATASFTLSTYAHAAPGMKRESANRMGKFLQGLQAQM